MFSLPNDAFGNDWHTPAPGKTGLYVKLFAGTAGNRFCLMVKASDSLEWSYFEFRLGKTTIFATSAPMM